MIHHHLQQVALCGRVSHIVQGHFPYCHNRNNKTLNKINTQKYIIQYKITKINQKNVTMFYLRVSSLVSVSHPLLEVL